MNVLHLCTKVPLPANDGGSLGIIKVIDLLILKGHKSTIVAANTPKHFQTCIPESFNGISIKPVIVNTGISLPKMILNILFSRLPYNVVRFMSSKFSATLKETLLNQQFDIIQLEGPHMGIYLPLIKKYSKAKIILRAHNVEYLLWQDIKDETTSLLKKFYLAGMTKRLRRFEARLISEVDGVIPVTNIDLQRIKAFSNPKNYVVIPFPVDISNYQSVENVLEKSVFFIGALDWIPNQNGLYWFLDNVWPVLKNCHPQISLHVAGRNVPEGLKSRLCDENVYFYGEVDDAKEFMNKFQIQIVPLFSGSGIRVKILEGMALAKTIITTSKGAEGIDITPGEELIIADDSESFILKIRDLINGNLKPDSFGTKARAFISKEFDNLALANRIESFYQRIASVKDEF